MQLNKYEQQYVSNGYQLPAGLSWQLVHHQRKKYNTPEYAVPLERVNNVMLWGVPIEYK